MGLLDRFRPNDSEERPPKPEGESHTRTEDLAVYDTTIHYRNGDTETFESFGIKTERDEYIRFNIPPVRLREYNGRYGDPNVWLAFDKRKEMWEVLSRRPVLDELEIREYQINFDVEYEWVERSDWQSKPSAWEPEIVNAEFELVSE